MVGFVRELRLLPPLAAALKLGEPILVDHDDAQFPRIRRVMISRKPPEHPAGGGLRYHYVIEIDVDEADDKCKATLVSSIDAGVVNVFTCDQRMESILVNALREGWKIGDLDWTTNNEITRGKLNIKDQNCSATSVPLS